MKRLASMFLAFALLLFAYSPTLALDESMDDDSYSVDLDDYIKYTISFNEASNATRSISTESNIDAAIKYVKSLNLKESGYDYIQSACLDELDYYKESNIILESYTVLVPSARAASYTYYGTYSGYDFYYQNVSVSDFRRNTRGSEKNTTNGSDWDNWIAGVFDLILSLMNVEWATPYSMFLTVLSLAPDADVEYGSYNEYVEQYSNVVTRVIYKLRSSRYDRCYQDQSGYLRVNQYFCPVGTDFSEDYYLIENTFAGNVQTNTLSKSEILSMANVYSNHNGEVIYKLLDHTINERMG